MAATGDMGRAQPASTDTAAPDRSFIPAIQGLRGFAALSVLLVHIRLMPANAGLWPDDLPRWLTLALGTGGRGVELFFIISGFLIPASLRRHRSVARFLRERVLRIMPLFVLLHLLLYAAGPLIGYKIFAGLTPQDYAASFLANLLFLAPLLDIPLAQQNAWSLTYEWLFYLWVVAYFCAGESSRYRGLRVPLVAGAVAVAWSFPSTIYFGLGLAFSVLAPRLRVGGGQGLALGLAALAAMYGACEYVSVLAGLPAAAILFALLLDPDSGPARLLGRCGFQYLGRVSYSLYLVHPFVLFALLLAAKRAGLSAPWSWTTAALFTAAGGVGSVAAAGLTHALVEQRLRRWLERAWDRRIAGPARLPRAVDPAGDRHDRDAEITAASR